MEKERILEAIRGTAKENGGQPLGRESFATATGIKESDWSGKFWSRWSDVVQEAGFEPNAMNQPRPFAELLKAVADLIKELGRFPTQPEMNLRRKNDPSFPSPDSIRRRMGGRSGIAKFVADFCRDRPEYNGIKVICDSVADQSENKQEDPNCTKGHVYLLCHGRDYKIGRSTDVTRRYRDIGVQMPLETKEIHAIETDDIVGIEAYWHNRFKDKRLKGEWFRLGSEDVKAFKSRKKM